MLLIIFSTIFVAVPLFILVEPDIISAPTLILNAPIVNCNEVNWSVLGISITVYNAILQFVLLSINTIYLFKKNA